MFMSQIVAYMLMFAPLKIAAVAFRLQMVICRRFGCVMRLAAFGDQFRKRFVKIALAYINRPFRLFARTACNCATDTVLACYGGG